MSSPLNFVSRNAIIDVYKMENSGITALGEIDQYSSLIWPECYSEAGVFQLNCPINEKNMELVKKGNVIQLKGSLSAGIIVSIESTTDEEYDFEYVVKGFMMEWVLNSRIVWNLFEVTTPTKASKIIHDLVNANAIEPTDSRRKIPRLYMAVIPEHFGAETTLQQRGGSLYNTIKEVAETAGIGFRIAFDPRTGNMVFEVQNGADRRVGNTEGNDPVVFDTSTEDIISSDYVTTDEDFHNTAYVIGEEFEEWEGSGDKTQLFGYIDPGYEGYDRKETSVDANDIHIAVVDDWGDEKWMSNEEYVKLLEERGRTVLAECSDINTYNATIRGIGYVAYEYGVDYNVGDWVTVYDRRFGIEVSAQITKVEQQFSDEYNISITIGKAFPTVMQKVRRMVNYSN